MTGTETRKRLEAIGEKVLAGQRISPDEALMLLDHEQVTTLGGLADLVRLRRWQGARPGRKELQEGAQHRR